MCVSSLSPSAEPRGFRGCARHDEVWGRTASTPSVLLAFSATSNPQQREALPLPCGLLPGRRLLFDDADHVSGRVAEQPERDDPRDDRSRHDGAAAARSDLGEMFVNTLDLDVDRQIGRVLLEALADRSSDTRLVGLDQVIAVEAGDRSALPSEEILVERIEGIPVGPMISQCTILPVIVPPRCWCRYPGIDRRPAPAAGWYQEKRSG